MFYVDAGDFGSTTGKDGNMFLAEEFDDPNKPTHQTDPESTIHSNVPKTNFTDGELQPCIF